MNALATFYNDQFKLKETAFPSWFTEYQSQNFSYYLEKGLPHRKTEQWQYVSLDKIKRLQFKENASLVNQNSDSNTINIVDGTISLPSELPKGVHVFSLSQAMALFKETCQFIASKRAHSQTNCFENINTALLSEGVFIHVEKNIKVSELLTLNFKNTQAESSQHTQVYFLVESGSSINVLEDFSGCNDGEYFNNHVSQVVLKENAKANIVKIIEESSGSSHISKTNTYQFKDSEYTNHSFALNGDMVRSDINVDLIESGSHATLNGLYLTTQKQNISHFTKVNHLCPHSSSDEFYKGILADQSKGTFNGSIFVAKDAQKTAASQQNKNLLLSKKAEVNTKPQLEIYADDVKCAHGATIGQLDEDALFYLQSRGLSQQESTTLLVNAFSNDLIEKLDCDIFSVLKIKLHQQIEQRLRDSNA